MEVPLCEAYFLGWYWIDDGMEREKRMDRMDFPSMGSGYSLGIAGQRLGRYSLNAHESSAYKGGDLFYYGRVTNGWIDPLHMHVTCWRNPVASVSF